MEHYKTTCAGCGGEIHTGDKIWLSDQGNGNIIVTHPLADCLAKYIEPEASIFLSLVEEDAPPT